ATSTVLDIVDGVQNESPERSAAFVSEATGADTVVISRLSREGAGYKLAYCGWGRRRIRAATLFAVTPAELACAQAKAIEAALFADGASPPARAGYLPGDPLA